MARRGDRIRCTVMFEKERVNGGKVQVPVSFSLNGRKIITKEGEDQVFMNYDKPFYPMMLMSGGSSALAKVRIKNCTQSLTPLRTGSESSASSKPRRRAQKRRILLGVSQLFRLTQIVSRVRHDGLMVFAFGPGPSGLGSSPVEVICFVLAH